MLNVKDDDFGKKVKKQLIDLNKSSKQLAIELGVSRTYLSEILNGTRKGINRRKEIADILEQWKEKKL